MFACILAGYIYINSYGVGRIGNRFCGCFCVYFFCFFPVYNPGISDLFGMKFFF